MFEGIKKILNLPIKSHSLKEFIQILEAEKAESVNAYVDRFIPKQFPFFSTASMTVGEIGDFNHMVKLEAKNSSGRKIVFSKNHFTAFGSSDGFADQEHRTKCIIRLLLIAEGEIKKINKEIPGIETNIFNSDDMPMDKETFEQLHKQASKLGVTA